MNIEEKAQIIRQLMPKAMLQAVSVEAKDATPSLLLHGDLVFINRFPFRVGRESRIRIVDGKIERIERPKKDNSVPNNDVYLIDNGHRLNISREHFQIEEKDGRYYVRDRGSACGTRVAEESLGGDDRGGIAEICDGDLISVGTTGTPFLFRFFTFDDVKLAI